MRLHVVGLLLEETCQIFGRMIGEILTLSCHGKVLWWTNYKLQKSVTWSYKRNSNSSNHSLTSSCVHCPSCCTECIGTIHICRGRLLHPCHKSAGVHGGAIQKFGRDLISHHRSLHRSISVGSNNKSYRHFLKFTFFNLFAE